MANIELFVDLVGHVCMLLNRIEVTKKSSDDHFSALCLAETILKELMRQSGTLDAAETKKESADA